jgi:integrase
MTSTRALKLKTTTNDDAKLKNRQLLIARARPIIARLLKIHFHTLRHWKAMMEYRRTKDILYVMKLLGHKNIANTLVYTQLVEFEGDEYCSAIASNLEEAKKLIEAGFEYVCKHDNIMIFRKRK